VNEPDTREDKPAGSMLPNVGAQAHDPEADPGGEALIGVNLTLPEVSTVTAKPELAQAATQALTELVDTSDE